MSERVSERVSERAREQRICITGNGNISQLLRMGVWGVAVNAFTRAPRATTTMKYHPRLSGGQLKAMLCGAPKGRAFTLHNKPDYGLVSSAGSVMANGMENIFGGFHVSESFGQSSSSIW